MNTGTSADRASIRVGNDERNVALKDLGAHLAAGRLTMEEYEERVTEALEARNRGQLAEVYRELGPAYETAPASGPVHQQLASMPGGRPVGWQRPGWTAFGSGLSLPLIAVAIWAFTGFGYFWPIWLVIPFLLCLAKGGARHSGHHGGCGGHRSGGCGTRSMSSGQGGRRYDSTWERPDRSS